MLRKTQRRFQKNCQNLVKIDVCALNHSLVYIIPNFLLQNRSFNAFHFPAFFMVHSVKKKQKKIAVFSLIHSFSSDYTSLHMNGSCNFLILCISSFKSIHSLINWTTTAACCVLLCDPLWKFTFFFVYLLQLAHVDSFSLFLRHRTNRISSFFIFKHIPCSSLDSHSVLFSVILYANE